MSAPSRRAGHLASLFLALAPAMAAAQDMMAPPGGPPMSENFELVVGVGAAYQPSYLGSEEHRLCALPLVSARWRTGWFAGVGGIGYALADSESRWSGGVRLGVDLGRDEGDAAALHGLGDIRARPELGAFTSYRIAGPLSVVGHFAMVAATIATACWARCRCALRTLSLPTTASSPASPQSSPTGPQCAASSA